MIHAVVLLSHSGTGRLCSRKQHFSMKESDMKRIAIVLVVALAGGAALAAQPFGGRGQGPLMGRDFYQGTQTPLEAPKPVTIEGKLVFVDTYPAVQTKDKTYILQMPRFYYYAYTDGIKEGAQVKAEGYEQPAFPGQDKPLFAVTKATIGAKTYDLATLEKDGMGMRGMMRGMMDGMMGGRGGPGKGGRW
jgi:hypothetical protein